MNLTIGTRFVSWCDSRDGCFQFYVSRLHFRLLGKFKWGDYLVIREASVTEWQVILSVDVIPRDIDDPPQDFLIPASLTGVDLETVLGPCPTLVHHLTMEANSNRLYLLLLEIPTNIQRTTVHIPIGNGTTVEYTVDTPGRTI